VFHIGNRFAMSGVLYRDAQVGAVAAPFRGCVRMVRRRNAPVAAR
jgi:hypothetical protein